MNNNSSRRGWRYDTSVTVLIFLLINILTVSSPLVYILAPVLLPVFLLVILAVNGQTAFLIATGVGLIPYLMLGDGRSAVAMLLPVILMLTVQYLIIMYQPKPAWALAATILSAFLGILLNGYLSIYVLQGSDFFQFSTQIADGIRAEFLAMLTGGPYELPPSQAQSIRALSDSITAQFVQDLVPGIVISWSMVSGYLSLRFASRFLNSEHFKSVSVPAFGELRITPVLLVFFLALSGSGLYLTGNDQRVGSLLFNTGFGVVTFLGAVGAMSLIWSFLTVYLKYKRSLPKLIFTAASLYFFSGSWMTILTIIDSVFDFRNISKKSLWSWIRYKVKQATKEAD